MNLIRREEKRKGLKGFKGQIIEIQHNRIKSPNWEEAACWLLTSVAEELNSGRPRKIQQLVKAGLEPRTAGL